MSRLILAGILDRHPRVRILTHHGGDMVPTPPGGRSRSWRRSSCRLFRPDDVGDGLTEAVRAELAELAHLFGEPNVVDTVIDDRFREPIWKQDRYGEVCMVIRRPSGTLLLSIKTFYPRGAYRLPTGGIHHGEGVLASLVRETMEETGLRTEVRRFLAWIRYRSERGPAGAEPPPTLFHTFAFLLDEVGGSLGTLDASERIEDWREIEPAELPAVADRLDRIESAGSENIGGDWAAWGHFRAVVHRAVAAALATPSRSEGAGPPPRS